ncbi:hypothetical protein J3E73DRAFT_263005 [Bipolaris maydis]|nr:hypothetical protein J3E73DRAFT_263005 [Bipolaris maydis]
MFGMMSFDEEEVETGRVRYSVPTAAGGETLAFWGAGVVPMSLLDYYTPTCTRLSLISTTLDVMAGMEKGDWAAPRLCASVSSLLAVDMCFSSRGPHCDTKATTENRQVGHGITLRGGSGQEFRPVRPPWPKMGGRTRKRAKDWLWGCGRRAFVGRHVCKWPLRAVQGRWKPLAVSNAMSWSSFAKRTLCLQAPKRDMCLVARRPSNMSRYYACLPWGALQSSFCAICWLPLACEENKRRTRAASTQPCSTGWDSRMPVCPRQANSDERKSHGADPRLDEMEAKQKTSDPSYPSAPACAPSRIKDAHKAVPGQGSVTNDERREAWAQGTPSA